MFLSTDLLLDLIYWLLRRKLLIEAVEPVLPFNFRLKRRRQLSHSNIYLLLHHLLYVKILEPWVGQYFVHVVFVTKSVFRISYQYLREKVFALF
jgi:hypothetical protein